MSLDNQDFAIEYQKRSASEYALSIDYRERGWLDASIAAQSQAAEYASVVRNELGIEPTVEPDWTLAATDEPYECSPDVCCPVCCQRLKQYGADQCERCLRHIAHHALEHGMSREAARGELAADLYGAC